MQLGKVAPSSGRHAMLYAKLEYCMGRFSYVSYNLVSIEKVSYN